MPSKLTFGIEEGEQLAFPMPKHYLEGEQELLGPRGGFAPGTVRAVVVVGHRVRCHCGEVFLEVVANDDAETPRSRAYRRFDAHCLEGGDDA